MLHFIAYNATFAWIYFYRYLNYLMLTETILSTIAALTRRSDPPQRIRVRGGVGGGASNGALPVSKSADNQRKHPRRRPMSEALA